MTPEQIEKLKAANPGFHKEWPDAVFSPWDDPPIGMKVRKGDETGTVIGWDDQEEVSAVIHRECPSCKCKRMNSVFGWWKIESDQYKKDGKPQVFLEYPPRWRPVEDAPVGR